MTNDPRQKQRLFQMRHKFRTTPYLLNDMKKSWKRHIARIEANHQDAGIGLPSIRQLPKSRQDQTTHCCVRMDSQGWKRELAQFSLKVRMVGRPNSFT